MKPLKERVTRGETLVGCFLNLGSPLTAEIVARAGFDWLLIDLEHGAGTEADVLGQLQAVEPTQAAVVVRVESHHRQRAHRVLDLGAHGIMFPRVNDAAEAEAAVAGLRYGPDGVRGVALMNRACEFGARGREYIANANGLLLGVVQIESGMAVETADEIAATDGVDVLFVGPWDLSHALGIFGDFKHAKFQDAIRRTASAAMRQKKASGILLQKPEDMALYHDLGYRFFACNSDGGLLNAAARGLMQGFEGQREILSRGF